MGVGAQLRQQTGDSGERLGSVRSDVLVPQQFPEPLELLDRPADEHRKAA